MSDRQKNHVLVLLGSVTSVLTIGGTMMQIGSLKGELITRLNEHEKRIDHHDVALSDVRENLSDIKARIHGTASRQGKLPGEVVARMNEKDAGD